MFADELRPMETVADPETAVDRLASLHTAATGSLRDALNRFLAEGVPPDSAERLTFRYPELRLTYRPTGPMPRMRGEPFASDPVEDTSSDGASWLSWRMSFAPDRARLSAFTAEIATGTSASTCARPCAVTTMSAGVVSTLSVFCTGAVSAAPAGVVCAPA